MIVVLSASNVAPLRDSQLNAFSMITWIPPRLASAVGSTTHAV